MPAVSPSDGPVAVTGASGYIGSWIVYDLLDQGYKVHACVRDLQNPAKVNHLLAMNENAKLRGTVELFRADLSEPGSYDEAFKGCCCVIHAGAGIGNNRETPQQVYDMCFSQVEHVFRSAEKAGTVKRFVFTSSVAAVIHPRPQGYVFTEKDWCGDNVEAYKGMWTKDNIPKIRQISYAMAKANSEKWLYDMAAKNGSLEAVAILPLHVVGPLSCADHDNPGTWQECLKRIAEGKPRKMAINMLWNLVDVRDVAKAHRLCAESTLASNGSRYILSAEDRSGEMFTEQLQAQLKVLFPSMLSNVPDIVNPNKAYDSPRAYCLLAKQELGIQPISVNDSIRDTVHSYAKLGLLQPHSKL